MSAKEPFLIVKNNRGSQILGFDIFPGIFGTLLRWIRLITCCTLGFEHGAAWVVCLVTELLTLVALYGRLTIWC